MPKYRARRTLKRVERCVRTSPSLAGAHDGGRRAALGCSTSSGRGQRERTRAASVRGRARGGGPGGALERPAIEPRGLAAVTRPARTRGRAARAGRRPRARARADPARADARVAVRVLPRRGRADGRRPRRDPAVGPDRPAVRGRPPVELRRLRGARPRAGVRHQRLRRDGARPVGMGRQAPGGEHRRGRPLARPAAGGAARRGRGRRALVPRGDAAVRDDGQPRALVRAARRRTHPQPHRRPGHAEGARRLQAARGGRAGQGPSAGPVQAHRARRRRAADRQPPAAHRPDRGAVPRRGGRGADTRPHPRLPPQPAARAPAPAGGLPLHPHGPQGGRGRQRRHARLDRPADRARRRRPAVPTGQAGRPVGARALRRARRGAQPRPARGPGPAADAGRRRHLPRLAARLLGRRHSARLLRAPALGLEARRRRRADVRGPADRLRDALRLDPGACARPLRQPRRDRRLSRLRQGLRPCSRRLRRRPTRTRPSGTTQRWSGPCATGACPPSAVYEGRPPVAGPRLAAPLRPPVAARRRGGGDRGHGADRAEEPRVRGHRRGAASERAVRGRRRRHRLRALLHLAAHLDGAELVARGGGRRRGGRHRPGRRAGRAAGRGDRARHGVAVPPARALPAGLDRQLPVQGRGHGLPGGGGGRRGHRGAAQAHRHLHRGRQRLA